MKASIYITAMLSLLAMASCSSKENQSKEKTDVSIESIDQSAPSNERIYQLGEEDAKKMLSTCSTIEDIEIQLLDIKARIHNISTRIGVEAATDYTKGFRNYVTTHNDSLAKMIF